ncbi:GPW/gp25 family protein [Yoonia sp.]|uniref:GPW/gp25 family protein n=1 Tax=Yoonia sp. TaxID=2212373 RepID=UPI0025DEDE1D|nr:GPW/gp25 family protein [Yoonia sp.]
MAQDHPGFLGRGWAFPPAFDEFTGGAVLVEAEEDINQSLRILFETRPGERVMHPTYGCRIHDYIFEPMNAPTMRAMEAAIARAILFFEPRITVQQIKVHVADAANGRLQIRIIYTVRQTNSRSNVVFPFYIHEGTLISSAPQAEAG